MSDRPDWVHCIAKHPGEPFRGRKAWCGRDLTGYWAFEDATHAILSDLRGGRLMACPECAAAVVKALAGATYREEERQA